MPKQAWVRCALQKYKVQEAKVVNRWREGQGRPNQLLPDSAWRTWLFLAGRGAGKALCVKTPIKVPQGWKRMGDLVAGDVVYGSGGEGVRVLVAHDPYVAVKAYRVIFSGGSEVVCDGGHLWYTYVSGVGGVRTTVEVADTLGDGHYVRLQHGEPRWVVGVVPVRGVEVRCITVDAWDSLYLCGRGLIPTHNTRSASEAVRELVEVRGYRRVHLVGRTAADVRDVMVTGDSGLLNITWDQGMPIYTPTRRRIEWPNGAVALTFSAEEPSQLRGPQCEVAWIDEVAQIPHETLSNTRLGLRLGKDPKMLLTTTPLPTPMIRELALDPNTHVVRGSTMDNALNLAPGYIEEVRRLYEGTRWGDQELHGKILEDVQGALWSHDDIGHTTPTCAMVSYTIGVDPAVTSGERSDETGIVVVGMGSDGLAYVMEDASGRMAPREWARCVVALEDKYARMNYTKIIAEANQGGELIRDNIQSISKYANVELVRASSSKAVRAFPVSTLYARGRIKHVGKHDKLEDQMLTWCPDKPNRSPDRVDALCYAVGPYISQLQYSVELAPVDQEAEDVAKYFGSKSDEVW
jgi:phage terminase large subunit-like protein